MLTITVEQHHIDSGETFNCRKCPIALAIREVLPEHHIAIGTRFADIDDEDYLLPKEAQQFVRDFDDKLKVGPFTFTMEKYEY